MGLKNLFKLEKLKILAFKKVGRGAGDKLGEFEAMFNPTSFEQKFAIEWGKNQGFNSSGKQVNYCRSKPSELVLELVVDGTGVDQIGVLPTKAVKDRIKDFLDLTFKYNGVIHEPNYLVVEWGALIFSCRLQQADVKYTLFDRDGTPLRAEIRVTFIGDKEVKKRAKEEQKSSPDLTHGRTVRGGDTLPLLTREVYGSAEHYLGVARANGLDDFRRLTPGRILVFPPLTELPR